MEKLQKRWSPREIVRRRAAEYPEDRTMRLSHEAIYRSIDVLPRGALMRAHDEGALPVAGNGAGSHCMRSRFDREPLHDCAAWFLVVPTLPRSPVCPRLP